MINSGNPSERLYAALRAASMDFMVSVPCKLLAGLLELYEKDSDVIYTPVTREEEGIGILAGAYLAGKRPFIAMQNSGLGNSINAISSLLNYYRIPVVFVISHRGTEGETIDAQRPMGKATKALLEAVSVPWYEISSIEKLSCLEDEIGHAYEEQRSVAFLFPFSFWEVP